MKTQPTLRVALALMTLSLAASTALADGRGGWDRGCGFSDRGYPLERHRPAYRYSRDLSRYGGRWERRPSLVHRHGPRYERPWAERRTFVYAEPWW